MVKRLLLNRIDVRCNQPAVNQGVERSSPVFPHPADALLSCLDAAAVGAQAALYRLILSFFIDECLFHDSLYTIDKPDINILKIPAGIMVFMF